MHYVMTCCSSFVLTFQGVNIYITIWDFDPENQFLKYDMVDEFSYDFTDLPGTSGKNLIISGIRPVEKSK